MPTYEYRCADCGHRFAQFYRSIASAQAAPSPLCPQCQGQSTERVPSAFAVSGPSTGDPGQAAHDQAQVERAAAVTPREQIERWRKSKPAS